MGDIKNAKPDTGILSYLSPGGLSLSIVPFLPLKLQIAQGKPERLRRNPFPPLSADGPRFTAPARSSHAYDAAPARQRLHGPGRACRRARSGSRGGLAR